MNKILKFPEINGPASKKEFEILAKLMNEVNEREEESLKAINKFLKKLKSISNHIGPLSKKEIDEMIKDYKNYYKIRLDQIREILEK